MLGLALLAGCGSDEQRGVVGTVQGFLGGAVADEPRAALEARDILSAGGSAADAAVALYFTLAVTLPSTASIGGGGVCVVYDARVHRAETLDFALRTLPDGGPIALPTAARGLFALHARHGKLRWEQLVTGGEGLARFGHPASRALAADLLAAAPILQADPELRATFLKADGTPYREGEILVQRDLSTLLSAIRARGSGELYSGPLAQRFIDGARAHGAAFDVPDLRGTAVAWRPAVPLRADDFLVFVPSPPAVAGLLELQVLGMAAPRWRRAAADERPHLFAQASVRAWADRTRWLAPDLTTAAPPPELVSERHLASLMASYRPDQRTPPAVIPQRREPLIDDAAASSFAVVDRDGNAVACNVTSYGLFGVGRMAAGTGVVLARTPDASGRGPQWLGPMIAAFAADRREVLRGFAKGEPQVVFAGAASGGAPASGALAAVALRTLIERRPLEESLDAPRLHIEGAPPDTVFVETGVQARPAGLVERGYRLEPVPVIGRVNAIHCPGGLKDAPNGCVMRVDRRGFGLAAGGF
jgi:gamma-glutamyltranspeptidase/glutathione hydrolase